MLAQSVCFAQKEEEVFLPKQNNTVMSDTIIEILEQSSFQYPITIDFNKKGFNIIILSCKKIISARILTDSQTVYEINPQFRKNFAIPLNTVFCPNIFNRDVIDSVFLNVTGIIWYEKQVRKTN